jgi:hypothetical protein
MVLTDEERKAKDKARRQTPEYKAQQKTHRQTPEYKAMEKARRAKPEVKARIKAMGKAHRARPEVKEKRKLREQTPEYKARKKEYEQSERGKELSKKRRDRPETRAKKIAYDLKNQDRIKAVQKIHAATPERRAYKLEFDARPDQIEKAKIRHAKHKVYRDDLRVKVLLGYSKRLSKSDIPCCNCCGENSHTEFLAIDHVLGKKQMNSIPELVKIGYSSKLKDYFLHEWIMDNNFPEGFQILCHNCNQSKENTKHNSCIHGNRDQTKFKPDKSASHALSLRMKVFPHYSKRHSNSDIACCRCCGENSNMEFLALDHILGRYEMNSIPELVKIGYSSKLKNRPLLVWIKNNNFPKGFQILCHNCNMAKGNSKDNKCPMENKPHF